MKVNQISSELGSNIEEMSRLAHDQSISESERNQKLKELKSSVITKIDAEINSISFAGKAFLNEIKKMVAAEDWAALPEPKSIKDSLSEMRTLVAILNSLENQLLPAIEAIQRLFFEAALNQINSLTNSEISSLDKQWGAAITQFRKSEEAAQAEKTSAIITASVGMGVAVISLAVKFAVTRYSSKQFDKAKPSTEQQEKLTATRTELTNAEIGLDKAKTKIADIDGKIATAEQNIASRTAQTDISTMSLEDQQRLRAELDTEITNLNEFKEQRVLAEDQYKMQKSTYKVASKIAGRVDASIDADNAAASRNVQTFRALLDITDSGGAVIQNMFKIISAAKYDKEAADKKIESEMAAYMVNFFASSVQNTTKSSSQILDGMNSVQSSCNASIQSADSSISQAIRAV